MSSCRTMCARPEIQARRAHRCAGIAWNRILEGVGSELLRLAATRVDCIDLSMSRGMRIERDSTAVRRPPGAACHAKRVPCREIAGKTPSRASAIGSARPPVAGMRHSPGEVDEALYTSSRFMRPDRKRPRLSRHDLSGLVLRLEVARKCECVKRSLKQPSLAAEREKPPVRRK